jgi:hypothetical protein
VLGREQDEQGGARERRDLVRTPSVLATSSAAYGDNPLMRVPTLVMDLAMKENR